MGEVDVVVGVVVVECCGGLMAGREGEFVVLLMLGMAGMLLL